MKFLKNKNFLKFLFSVVCVLLVSINFCLSIFGSDLSFSDAEINNEVTKSGDITKGSTEGEVGLLSVTVEWGSLEFQNKADKFNWNTQKHAYAQTMDDWEPLPTDSKLKNNQIKITNNSSLSVLCTVNTTNSDYFNITHQSSFAETLKNGSTVSSSAVTPQRGSGYDWSKIYFWEPIRTFYESEFPDGTSKVSPRADVVIPYTQSDYENTANNLKENPYEASHYNCCNAVTYTLSVTQTADVDVNDASTYQNLGTVTVHIDANCSIPLYDSKPVEWVLIEYFMELPSSE